MLAKQSQFQPTNAELEKLNSASAFKHSFLFFSIYCLERKSKQFTTVTMINNENIVLSSA